MKRISFEALEDEINQTLKSRLGLKSDSAFVLWFLRSYLADTEAVAIEALTGGTGDKDVDAVLVDHKAKQVHIVQGKYRLGFSKHLEKRQDVSSFCDLALLPWEKAEVSKAYYHKISEDVRHKLKPAIKFVIEKGYSLHLYFVTTGKCSETVKLEAREKARKGNGPVYISIIDGEQVAAVFNDYLEGVAPGVPELSLEISSEGNVHSEGLIYRFDPKTKIESWIFTMSADRVGELYDKAGIRLFARNIRGFLGSSNEINKAMADTVTKHPENFWYYNNGVTVVCDDARRETRSGKDFLLIERPQVINGQQTTRTLSETSSDEAGVLVRVIRIPRKSGDEARYDGLVSAIVRATNWQNAIKTSDLVSNDYIQVLLEREFRKVGYHYLRKRQTKSEAKRLFGNQTLNLIHKEEIAQAVAATMYDPYVVRSGKENLFSESYYTSIFGQTSVGYYLPRYWLMKEVQSVAKGYIERSYAKWLVIHFSWKDLAINISGAKNEPKFRRACENDDDRVLRPLRRALTALFRAALAFYRLEKGEGEAAKDVSKFFYTKGLLQPFKSFWTSKKNRYRHTYENALQRFSEKLQSMKLD